jgi:metal-responsive CopG/Arc/MetJ family transcriptional regulator
MQCNALHFASEDAMDAQLTVRIEEELGRALDEAAKRLDRKRSDVVRMALREFLFGSSHSDRPVERVRTLLGSVESGIPRLAERHREYIVESLKRGR